MQVAGGALEAAGGMKLPQHEWTPCGPSCSLPCFITFCAPCSCIAVYMNWMKIMPTEAVPRALWQTLANCVGFFFAFIGSMMFSLGLIAIDGTIFILVGGALMFCFPACQTWGLYEQRKRLGSWMNMKKEDQTDLMQGCCCNFCCACFQVGAEGATVDTWLSTYFLMGPALQAAWVAQKNLSAAAQGAGAVIEKAGESISH